MDDTFVHHESTRLINLAIDNIPLCLINCLIYLVSLKLMKKLIREGPEMMEEGKCIVHDYADLVKIIYIVTI